MALTVGITGGIGSGKSIVCQAFNVIGIPVFNADVVSKQILETDISVHQSLFDFFGVGIFSNNIPDRKKLAELVFNDAEKLAKLNSIMHPKVREDFAYWVNKNAHLAYVIQESAILFETGLWKYFDKTILVAAPINERIHRVIHRDTASEDEITKRINNQWTDEQKAKLANFRVQNSNSDRLIPQLLEIHQQLLLLSTHG